MYDVQIFFIVIRFNELITCMSYTGFSIIATRHSLMDRFLLNGYTRNSRNIRVQSLEHLLNYYFQISNKKVQFMIHEQYFC